MTPRCLNSYIAKSSAGRNFTIKGVRITLTLIKLGIQAGSSPEKPVNLGDKR